MEVFLQLAGGDLLPVELPEEVSRGYDDIKTYCKAHWNLVIAETSAKNSMAIDPQAARIEVCQDQRILGVIFPDRIHSQHVA